MDNTELLQRIEKLEKQVELLQAEITAIKNIEVSEKAREKIDKIDRANKLVSLMENLSGEKMPDAQKNEELEVLHNVSQQAEIEVQSSMNTIEEFIDNSADKSDFEWKLYKNGIEITKYIGMSKKTVVIPNNIDGKPVLSIGREAFKNCSELERVRLPQCLKYIGEYSFYSCENLVELSIPDGIREIGALAFYNTGITSIKIPKVKLLPNEVFSCCRNLKSIIFPDSLEVVGAYAFSECINLSEVHLPNGVLRIEYDAFSGCKNLSKIHLPQTLNYIGKYAFAQTSITNIRFPQNGITFDECIFGGYCKNVKFIFEGMMDTFADDICFKSFDEGIFYCLPGSAAQKYARKQDIKVKHLNEFEKDMQEEK